MCPGSPLIFPHHFGPKNSWDKRVYLEQEDESNCYEATDFLMFWLQ